MPRQNEGRRRAGHGTGWIDLTFFHALADYLEVQFPVGEDRTISGRIEHYNGLLDLVVVPYGVPWHGGDNHLGALPAGITNWAGVDFDLRGVIQLRAGHVDLLMQQAWRWLPERVAGASQCRSFLA